MQRYADVPADFADATLVALAEEMHTFIVYTDHVLRRLGYKSALQAFKEAQGAAGVGPYRLHDYRRSVARRLEQGGVPRSTAMKITGHRTEHIFRQYAVGEDEDVRDALRAVTPLVTIETDDFKDSC